VVLNELQNPSIVDTERGVRDVGQPAVSMGIASDDERVVGRGHNREDESFRCRPCGARSKCGRQRRLMRVVKERAPGVSGVVRGGRRHSKNRMYTKGGRRGIKVKGIGAE
jgi:hypothetical protein